MLIVLPEQLQVKKRECKKIVCFDKKLVPIVSNIPSKADKK